MAFEQGLKIDARESPNLAFVIKKCSSATGLTACFAKKAIDEEFIGLTVEVSDASGLYFDILPFIGLVAIIFICLRFIGLGTNNTALYIFSGIGASVFMGFTIAMRSLPRESDRL